MMEHYDLTQAVTTLHCGGAILFPTDTIWGIGCDACSQQAVQKVRQLKNREEYKPFVVLVDSVEMLREYVQHVHPRIETLLSYHLRPLTIVYDQAKELAPNVTSPDGSVGIRVPNNDYCKALIKKFGRPIIATSANVSNEPFPDHFGQISSTILQGVDYISTYQQNERLTKSPSVVARLSDKSELIFLRE